MPSQISAEIAASVVAITPSDSTDVTNACASGFIIGGTAGTVVFQNQLGTTLTITNGLAGVVYPLAAVRIMAASTATGILGLS